MPKYRQLHTKIVDSYDFNDMPNDFIRVFWLLLIVVADSEGRSIDNPAWLRSKMFPLREDVELEDVSTAVEWLANRKMIIRYQVGGRKYFYIPTWKTYQTGTDKEAASTFPAPPELLQSNSGVTPEQVRVNTIQYNADSNTNTIQYNADSERKQNFDFSENDAIQILVGVTGMLTFPAKEKEERISQIFAIIKNKGSDTVEYLKPFYGEWIKRKYSKSNLAWLDWAVSGEIPLQRSGNGNQTEKRVYYDAAGRPVEL